MKATRCAFGITSKADTELYEELLISFDFSPGFAESQKRRNVASMHEALAIENPGLQILEVSTKSATRIGSELSAFHLRLKFLGKWVTLEVAFQSSKVFADAGPFRHLLDGAALDAKREMAALKELPLIGFEDDSGVFHKATPDSSYYDWLYLRALLDNPHLLPQVQFFDTFTDVEFGKNKSGFVVGLPFNCQARSCAIAVSLFRQGGLDAVRNAVSLGPASLRGRDQDAHTKAAINTPSTAVTLF